MPDLPPLPPISTQPISVVLLAHNAAEHVQALVTRWAEVLQERGQEYEIIFVDAGSVDGTIERTGELVAQWLPLRVLRSERSGLLGAALRIGLEAARMPLVATALCSPEYDPADLKRFLAEIDKVHLLSGFRAGRKMPWYLWLLGGVWRTLIRVAFSYSHSRQPGWLGWRNWFSGRLARIFFGVRLRDVHCPFRLFRREILARAPLQSRSEFALVEFLAKVNFAGCFMGEDITLSVAPDVGEFPPQPLGRRFRDAYRVFTHPDFGPAEVSK